MWYEHREGEQDKSQNYNQLEGGAEAGLSFQFGMLIWNLFIDS